MPKIEIKISDKVTYSDSSGRSYKGPLEDAPLYVQAAVKDMDRLMQEIDSSFSSLVNQAVSGSIGVKPTSYKMTIGKSFDWYPSIASVLMMLGVIIWLTIKILMGG